MSLTRTATSTGRGGDKQGSVPLDDGRPERAAHSLNCCSDSHRSVWHPANRPSGEPCLGNGRTSQGRARQDSPAHARATPGHGAPMTGEQRRMGKHSFHQQRCHQPRPNNGTASGLLICASCDRRNTETMR
jgi:hypothetical protein